MRKKLFRYPGSKTKVINELIAAFPPNFRDLHWLEAFGGSGIITYEKPISKAETFNDFDEGISAIFYCLLFKFEELGFRLEEFKSTSGIILKWIQSEEHREDMKTASIVDKAISKLYQLDCSYSGKGETFGYRVNPNVLRTTLWDYDTWKSWRKRFRDVQLLSKPANDLIQAFDSPEMFVYCDPPYVISAKGHHYELNFTEKDHIELAETLHSMQGKFLLSYDDTPIIQELYANDEINDLMIGYSMKVHEKEKKKELLISNYKLPKRPQLTDFLEVDQNVKCEKSTN